MTPQHLCASEHHSGTTFGPPHVTDDSGHRRRSGGGIPCHEAIVSATAKTARSMHGPLSPPRAPLTALRRGSPVPLSRPEFDRAAADRLYPLLAELTATA